jgi:hypothetical protein
MLKAELIELIEELFKIGGNHDTLKSSCILQVKSIHICNRKVTTC